MDLTKLKNMYRSADPRKLNQMLSEAIEYGDKAEVLKRKKRSIIENLISTVGEKFPKKTDEERWDRDRGSAQLKQMETQWRICAASMVTVKRSIKLSGFHSQGEGGSQNLYANSKYGIKVHKRYSGYSPFYFIDIMKHCDDPAPFKITVNMLHMTNINSGVLNFAVLDSIPQLDTERVDLLKGITQETVWLIDSWRNFYRKMDVSRIKRIDEINDMNQYNDVHTFPVCAIHVCVH